MAINHVVIAGNVTRDSELKQTSGGTSVLTFSVAVNESRKNPSTGEWEDRPNYFDCVMYGTRAEKLQRHILKGTKLAVSGRLNWRSWQSQDGSKRTKVDIIADNIEFMSRAENAQHVSQTQTAAPVAAAPSAQGDFYDSDIPF